MTMISPSILSADFCRLGAECSRVLEAGAQMLHYDVMDGHFVPNISFGVPVLKSLHAGLPDAFYDVHLMISHPLAYVEPFAKAGATLLNFHLESEDDVTETLRAIRALGCKTGLTIKPATPAEALFPYLDDLDLVLIMSVEPGFGGQSFQPAALEKLRILAAERAKRGAHFLLEVDGGVDASTAPLCVEAGADVLVAGSAVFGAKDPAEAVRALAAL
jgi:ribulose-phosphate 3-epimerase